MFWPVALWTYRRMFAWTSVSSNSLALSTASWRPMRQLAWGAKHNLVGGVLGYLDDHPAEVASDMMMMMMMMMMMRRMTMTITMTSRCVNHAQSLFDSTPVNKCIHLHPQTKARTRFPAAQHQISAVFIVLGCTSGIQALKIKYCTNTEQYGMKRSVNEHFWAMKFSRATIEWIYERLNLVLRMPYKGLIVIDIIPPCQKSYWNLLGC